MQPMRLADAPIEVRFDDLTRPDALALRFSGLVEVIEARRTEEVAGALQAAEAASGDGRWVAGFLCYEAAPGLDPALRVRHRAPADPFADLPQVWFAVFERAERASSGPGGPPAPAVPPPPESAWEPSIARERFDRSVEAIREHIRAGDTYQVNYTLRLRAPLESDPAALYRHLCRAQRASYSAYLRTGRYHVLSASPELFFRIDGDRVTTRPMKGTARRGRPRRPVFFFSRKR